MKSMMKEMNINDMNMENLETVTGGTTMSIPGGKRSGRKDSETALEILNMLGDRGSSFLESLGLKEKRVNNSIYDRTVKDYSTIMTLLDNGELFIVNCSKLSANKDLYSFVASSLQIKK